jgi:excisionase family DNA binding protein
MDRLLTVDQAGELLNTGPRFVRRLIAERRIEFAHMGRHVRISESALIKFVEAGSMPVMPFLLQVAVHERGSPTLRQSPAIAFRALSGALSRARRSPADKHLRPSPAEHWRVVGCRSPKPTWFAVSGATRAHAPRPSVSMRSGGWSSATVVTLESRSLWPACGPAEGRCSISISGRLWPRHGAPSVLPAMPSICGGW